MRIQRGQYLSKMRLRPFVGDQIVQVTTLLLPFSIRKGAGSQPGLPGSTGFLRANSQTGFYLDPDRFQARVGRVPGRPAGPVRVSKLWLQLSKTLIQKLKDMRNLLFIHTYCIVDCNRIYRGLLLLLFLSLFCFFFSLLFCSFFFTFFKFFIIFFHFF